MSDQDPLARGLAALSQFFVGESTRLDTLLHIAEMAIEAVPQASFAGITMIDEGRLRTSVFTDPRSPEIDESQYETGSGPCLESFETGEIRLIDSTRADVRWPAFSAACVEHGILSTLSAPLTVDGVATGALNVYAARERAFGADAIRTITLFAVQAAVVLANAAAYWSARARAEQLEAALETRGAIEQAKGIIMATARCSADDAFQILVTQSQQQNVKLREIANEIVRNATRRP